MRPSDWEWYWKVFAVAAMVAGMGAVWWVLSTAIHAVDRAGYLWAAWAVAGGLWVAGVVFMIRQRRRSGLTWREYLEAAPRDPSRQRRRGGLQ